MENEKRLIDANKVINFMQECLDESQDKRSVAYFAFESIIECLKQEPTVDAVEVVWCEKCLYRSQYSDENGLYKCGGIQTEDGDLVLMVKPDHFCSYGERKDDD